LQECSISRRAAEAQSKSKENHRFLRSENSGRRFLCFRRTMATKSHEKSQKVIVSLCDFLWPSKEVDGLKNVQNQGEPSGLTLMACPVVNDYVYSLYTYWRKPMEASVVDLRYRMKDVLKALDRNEEVRILYHGKVKGIIQPSSPRKKAKVQDHPFFNAYPDGRDVQEQMSRLRGGRYNDL
jgi:hypothetical protein